MNAGSCNAHHFHCCQLQRSYKLSNSTNLTPQHVIKFQKSTYLFLLRLVYLSIIYTALWDTLI